MIIKYELEDRQKIITENKAQGLALKSDKRLVDGNYLEFVKTDEIIVPKLKISIIQRLTDINNKLLDIQAKSVKHDEDIASILLARGDK
jgi:hypothetical protein